MFHLAKPMWLCFSQNGKRLARGFSLVEVLVGVAIIGVVMAVALPSFSEWIKNVRIRTAAEAVVAGVQAARSEAIRRNAPVVFTLLPAADATLLWRVDCVTVTATCPVSIHRRALTDGNLLTTGGVMAVTFDAGANVQIRFDSFGRATNLAGVASWNVESADTYSGERPQRILIEVGGASRICDPHLASSVLGSCP